MISIATPGRISLYGSMRDFPLKILLGKIDLLLTRLGMDAADLSRASGIGEPQISKWRKKSDELDELLEKKARDGKPPVLTKTEMRGGPNIWDGVRIAEALKVTAEYLASPDMGSPPVVLTDDEKAIITAYRAHRPELDALMRAIASLATRDDPPPADGMLPTHRPPRAAPPRQGVS